MATPPSPPSTDVSLQSLFHLPNPITTAGLIRLAHAIWAYISHEVKGISVDVSKLGIAFEQTVATATVSKMQAVELIFQHAFIPTLTADEQALVQAFVNDLLPTLVASFENVYALAKKSGFLETLIKFCSCGKTQ